jgi:hypothetical protein
LPPGSSIEAQSGSLIPDVGSSMPPLLLVRKRCRSAPSIQKSARMLLDDSREIVIQRR